ncbi:MAG: hypothetical protein HOM55_06085 [Proteobacteria bacterium]|jgi:hypothetical protein|nr:hypothetical protein [Pseudomonadota bacterium]
MKPTINICLTILWWLCVTANPVFAHHSTAFYTDELVEIAGELVGVDWRNPHTVLSVKSIDNQGTETLWRIEGNSIFNYLRKGVTRELFRVNDQVKVFGFRSSRDAHALAGANMLLPGRREVLLWEGQEARFSDEAIVVAGADEDVVDTIGENKGVFRVWSSPRGIFWGQQMANQPFTEAAIANRESYDMLDNFATRCEGEGMPRIMVNPHSFEFIDHGEQIALRTELYDTERIIHMDETEIPEDAPASKLGYSIGAWDGNTLVITTRHVSWPFFDNRGSAQSEAVQIVERFSLSEDQGQLDFEITVTDPPNLYQPAVLKGHWLALGHTLPPYNCQVN